MNEGSLPVIEVLCSGYRLVGLMAEDVVKAFDQAHEDVLTWDPGHTRVFVEVESYSCVGDDIPGWVVGKIGRSAFGDTVSAWKARKARTT